MKTIRQLREENGWTQLDLAVKAGVTPSTVYKWEAWRIEPSASHLRKIAKLFNVSMDDIELDPPGEQEKPRREITTPRLIAPPCITRKRLVNYAEVGSSPGDQTCRSDSY